MEILPQKIPGARKNDKSLKSPLSVGIEITNRCDLGCLFCYNESHNQIDMKITDFSKIISILKRIKVFSIIISGGEPLCHNNFKNFCEKIKKSGLIATLFTNGILIKNYANLINSTFKNIYISIDGPENIHNKMRGKNCFRSTINNLKTIKIKKVMCATLTKLNINYLEEIIKIAIKYEFDGLCFFAFKPTGMGRKRKALLTLNDYDLKKINNKIIKFRNQVKIPITYENPLSTICYAGKLLIYILPNGKIKPCAFSNFIVGNILGKKWNKLWKKCQTYPSTCHAF